MKVKIYFYLYFIFFFLTSFINTKLTKIILETNDPEITIDYHPLRITFDYKNFEINENKKIVNIFKKILEQVSKVFSEFINIKNTKIIKKNIPPSKLCDNDELQDFDRDLKMGISTDLIIYPILFNKKKKNSRVNSEICAIDSNKRPIIALLKINKKIKLNNKSVMRDYMIQIMHHVTHILGFRYDTFKNWRVYRNKNLNFNGLRNINEKTIDLWNGVKFKIPNTHYANIKNDIMSRKRNNRILVFTSITLIILQRTRWYQINLSLCGCSLNGNCEYLRHPIAIYINSNLNGDFNTHCYLNENVNTKCTLLNNTYVPTLKLANVDEKEYYNYFEGNHSLNKLNIWKPSIPNNPKEQIIYLVSPKGKCKNPQRTIYFFYPDYLNLTNPELDKYTIEPYKITNKNMTVYHSYIKTGAADFIPFFRLMKYHNISYNPNYFMSNFFSCLYRPQKRFEAVSSLGKYQLLNVMFETNNLGNKLLMYLKYRNIQKLFPNDFQYVPESFILSQDREILSKRFKDYKQTEQDLWVYKPPEGLQGIGIKFLKNGEDFLKYSFISKYISNPHLLYGKKYHLRMYVIITGVLPLKIYVFDEGQVMRASGEYIYDINKIEKATSFLTNVHQNADKPGYNKHVTFDTEVGSEWTFKTLAKYIERNGGSWKKIWDEIKDISIKTIISNFEDMRKVILSDFKQLRSNSIFHRFGFDILLDDNLKPWLLEVNIKPAMELYNIINVRNKIKVETDRLNLMGMIPFDHFTQKPLDEEMTYKDDVDEAIQLSICEFERPHGTLERVFPVKKTLNYYKKFFINPDKYNLALWNLIEKEDL